MRVVHFFILFSILGIIACSQGETKKTTKGGYEYIVHKEGSGDQAKINDYLLYTIRTSTDLGKELQNETDYSQVQPLKIFDPASEEAKGNIWNEVFLNAKVGDSITLVMPSDSMPYPNPELEGAKSLMFTIAIKEILDEQAFEKFRMGKQEEFEKKAAEGQIVADKVAEDIKVTLADYKANKLTLTDLTDGVKVYYNEKGTGTQGANGKTVTAQYYGVLEDGTMFDNSFSRGQAFSFQVGQGMVIKGWDIAFANLRVGDKATVFIPAAVGYGEQGAGSIPPNAPLVFYVEVEDVK
jgi:FKBP-type peptidyl-prolyl cis-trans isomerase FkpA